MYSVNTSCTPNFLKLSNDSFFLLTASLSLSLRGRFYPKQIIFSLCFRDDKTLPSVNPLKKKKKMISHFPSFGKASHSPQFSNFVFLQFFISSWNRLVFRFPHSYIPHCTPLHTSLITDSHQTGRYRGFHSVKYNLELN